MRENAITHMQAKRDGELYNRCHFCNRTLRKKEDYCKVRYTWMHRWCLDQWLEDHPPLNEADAPERGKALNDAFEELRKKLIKQHA